MLKDLLLKHKLFAITGDNASNNDTLCDHLYESLLRQYSDRFDGVKERMRFHGKTSFVRCLAHITNLICDDILKDLKSGSTEEAKALLDNQDKKHKDKKYNLTPDHLPSTGKGAVAKIRLLNLWILRSDQRLQDWAKYPRCIHRKPRYDVKTRWNSAYDMIQQALDLQQEYTEFCGEHRAVKALLPTSNEWVTLHQLAYVLKPFKDKIEEVSKEMPLIVKSLEVYWELDILLNNIKDKVGIFKDLEPTIRDAVIAGITKNSKYQRKMEKHVLLFVAHILDP